MVSQLRFESGKRSISTPGPKSKKRMVNPAGETCTLSQNISGTVIALRAKRIARGWTAEQRSERLRAGRERTAWLLKLVEYSQNEIVLQ